MSFERSELDRNYALSYCDWVHMTYRYEAREYGHGVEGILALGVGRLVSLGRSARLPVNFTCEF